MYESWKFLSLKWWKNNKWTIYRLANCVKLRSYIHTIITFTARTWRSWTARLCIGIVIRKNREDNKDGAFAIETKNCWQLKFNLWNTSDHPRCLIGSTEILLRQRLILLLNWQVYQLMIKHGRYSRKLYDNESLMFDRQKIIKLNCYMFKILRIMNSC